MYEREIFHIDEANAVESAEYYNMVVGGMGTGSGENHPNYGKPLSDEQKAKLSAANIGKTLSEETKAKISAAKIGENHPNYGKTLSDEQKAKMSASIRGENHPKFNGYYHTPNGKFITGQEAESAFDGLLSDKSIQNWCNNPDKIISKASYAQSPYLKSLDESPVGKTFRDLGFYFEPV